MSTKIQRIEQEIPTEDRAFVQAMTPFMDWVVKQGISLHLRVSAYIAAITDVQHDLRLVEIPSGYCVDVWGMHDALAALRDLATSAGFPDAAAFCEQEREMTQAAIAHVEQMFVAVK